MLWLWITLGVLGALLLAIIIYGLIFGFKFGHYFANPKRCNRQYQIDLFHYHEEPEYKLLKREPITFVMKDGYEIGGDISINDPKRFVIVVHGFGSTCERAVKYASVFTRLGYSIVLFDLRGHGDNKRVRCTMGKQEAKDLNEIINKIISMYGDDIELGLYGCSMGAASALLVTKYTTRPNWIVSDCAYSSLKDMAYGYFDSHHMPRFPFSQFLNFVITVFYGFSYKDTSAKDAIKNVDIPVLFIHGKLDKMIPVWNVDKLYEAAKGYKEKVIFENSEHGKSMFDEYDRYCNVVEDFLNKVNNF